MRGFMTGRAVGAPLAARVGLARAVLVAEPVRVGARTRTITLAARAGCNGTRLR